jgi:hypothetical protein
VPEPSIPVVEVSIGKLKRYKSPGADQIPAELIQAWEETLHSEIHKLINLAKFKYLGTTLTDQDCMQEEIKGRLNSGNACYHSVQSLLSSRLLYRNIKVKIYKTIILPVVLYECETWSLTLREEHRLKVFENKVLRRIFGPKRDEVTGEWRKLHNEELHILYSSKILLGRSNRGE